MQAKNATPRPSGALCFRGPPLLIIIADLILNVKILFYLYQGRNIRNPNLIQNKHGLEIRMGKPKRLLPCAGVRVYFAGLVRGLAQIIVISVILVAKQPCNLKFRFHAA